MYRSHGHSRRYGRRSRRGRYRRCVKGRHMTATRVRRIINAELKFNTLSVGPQEITPTVGDIIPVTSNIVQGDLATQRIGNWIKPVNLHGTVTLQGNGAAAGAADAFLVRCGFVCWYNDEQFDPPAVAQIVQDPLAPFGPLNIGNRGSFKQLWSRKMLLSTDDDNTYFFRVVPYYLRIRCPQTTYDAGNPKKYQIFFYILSDSILGAGQNPIFNLDFTVRFTDS